MSPKNRSLGFAVKIRPKIYIKNTFKVNNTTFRLLIDGKEFSNEGTRNLIKDYRKFKEGSID